MPDSINAIQDWAEDMKKSEGNLKIWGKVSACFSYFLIIAFSFSYQERAQLSVCDGKVWIRYSHMR